MADKRILIADNAAGDEIKWKEKQNEKKRLTRFTYTKINYMSSFGHKIISPFSLMCLYADVLVYIA